MGFQTSHAILNSPALMLLAIAYVLIGSAMRREGCATSSNGGRFIVPDGHTAEIDRCNRQQAKAYLDQT